MRSIEFINSKTETTFGKRVDATKLVSAEELELKTYKLQGVEHVNNILDTDTPVMLKACAYNVVKRGEWRPIHLELGMFKTRDNRFKPFFLCGIIRDGKLYVVVEKANEAIADINPTAPMRVVSIGAAHKLMRAKFFPGQELSA